MRHMISLGLRHGEDTGLARAVMPLSTYQGCWLEKAVFGWFIFDCQCLSAHLSTEITDMQAGVKPYNYRKVLATSKSLRTSDSALYHAYLLCYAIDF